MVCFSLPLCVLSVADHWRLCHGRRFSCLAACSRPALSGCAPTTSSCWTSRRARHAGSTSAAQRCRRGPTWRGRCAVLRDNGDSAGLGTLARVPPARCIRWLQERHAFYGYLLCSIVCKAKKFRNSAEKFQQFLSQFDMVHMVFRMCLRWQYTVLACIASAFKYPTYYHIYYSPQHSSNTTRAIGSAAMPPPPHPVSLQTCRGCTFRIPQPVFAGIIRPKSVLTPNLWMPSLL